MAEHDYVNSEEARLVRVAQEALFTLQRHLESVGYHYTIASAPRYTLTDLENQIRQRYKDCRLPLVYLGQQVSNLSK